MTYVLKLYERKRQLSRIWLTCCSIRCWLVFHLLATCVLFVWGARRVAPSIAEWIMWLIVHPLPWDAVCVKPPSLVMCMIAWQCCYISLPQFPRAAMVCSTLKRNLSLLPLADRHRLHITTPATNCWTHDCARCLRHPLCESFTPGYLLPVGWVGDLTRGFLNWSLLPSPRSHQFGCLICW